jgi:hypothetical protein
MNLRLVFLFLALLPFARATTVIPPVISELVDEADSIYRGRVTAVQARRVERPDGGSVIKTFVTVAIDRVLKGPERKETTLEFLGGTVGDETLEVGGMPRFTVGERGIVFVQNNGQQFCPLVRLMHGRYRIQQDDGSGREFVARDNGRPLKQAADVALPMNEAAAAPSPAEIAGAMTPDAFEAEIGAQLRRSKIRLQPH